MSSITLLGRRSVAAAAALAVVPLALALAPSSNAAETPPTKVRKAVFEALDGLADGKNVAETKRAIRRAGVRKPDALVEAIRAGRPSGETRGGQFVVPIEDARGRKSELHVAIPKAYKPDGTWGILLLLHGLGGDGEQLLGAWVSRAAKERYIVIAPSAQKEPEDSDNEDNAFGAAGALLPQWWDYRGGFPMAALSWAKRNYAHDADRVVLTGYSMGGFGSWNLGLRYADRFSGVAPMAGGMSRLEYLGGADDRSRRLLENGRELDLFFCHGSNDRVVMTRMSRELHAELDERGIHHTYVEVPGGGHRLPAEPGRSELSDQIDEWFSRQTRNPSPATIHHVALGEYNGRSYWTRIESLSDKTPVKARKGPSGHVVARADRRTNTIAIETKGVGQLRVFLDPKLVDVSKPVTITVNGKAAHQGAVKPSIESVLDAWRDREDTALVYAHSVLLDIEGDATPAPTTQPTRPTTPARATETTKPAKKKRVLY